MVNSYNSAVRAIDIALAFVQREEQRVYHIIESESSTPEERLQALQDLAFLSSQMVRELAELQLDPGDNMPTHQPPTEPLPDALREASFHQDVCDHLSEGVYFVDKQRCITYWNNGAQNLTGFDRADAVGRHCYDNFLRHVDAEGRTLCFGGCPLAATLKDGKGREAEVFLHRKSGEKVPVSVRVSPVVDNSGNLIGAVEVFSNIASTKALEKRANEMEELAFRDSLTSLSNRRHIELKLNQAVEEVEQFGRKTGIILFDIDKFRLVNEAHGRTLGDMVLRSVADSLAETLRPGNAAGRWAGEEFLLIATNVTLAELEVLAEQCRLLIATSSVAYQREQIQVTVSAGAVLLKRGESAETALRRAEELLYVARCQGGNSVRTRM